MKTSSMKTTHDDDLCNQEVVIGKNHKQDIDREGTNWFEYNYAELKPTLDYLKDQ